jgi:hypothetical protein
MLRQPSLFTLHSIKFRILQIELPFKRIFRNVPACIGKLPAIPNHPIIIIRLPDPTLPRLVTSALNDRTIAESDPDCTPIN